MGKSRSSLHLDYDPCGVDNAKAPIALPIPGLGERVSAQGNKVPRLVQCSGRRWELSIATVSAPRPAARALRLLYRWSASEAKCCSRRLERRSGGPYGGGCSSES